MKKVIFGVLCGVLILSIATGCGSNKPTVDTNNGSNTGSNESTELKGYQIKINDTAFNFPCKFEKFMNAGYTMTQEDANRVLASTQDDEYVNIMDKNDEWQRDIFGIYIRPNGNDIKDAIVEGGIWRSSYDENFAYYLEGLELGEATVQDIINRLGKPEEPKSFDENEFLLTFIYNQNKQQTTLNIVDGKLNAVYIFGEKKKDY